MDYYCRDDSHDWNTCLVRRSHYYNGHFSIAHFYSALFTTPLPRVFPQVRWPPSPGYFSGILGSQTIRPRHPALGMQFCSIVSLRLAVDRIAPIGAGDLDEHWTFWSRLIEDPTRHRRKTAAHYGVLGHATHIVPARPSCFHTSSVAFLSHSNSVHAHL